MGKRAYLVCCLAMAVTAFGNQPSLYAPPNTQNKAAIPIETWPKIKNERSYDLFSFLEFMEWRYSSPSLVYGRDGVGLSNASPAQEIAVANTGTSYFPNFEYTPGFKVGIGSQFGPGKIFDLVVSYTWLYTAPQGSVSGDQISASFLPINYLNSSTSTSNNYSLASLGLNLHFNWIELQSGYTFDPSRYITIRPYISLQSLIIEGDLRARYEFTLTATSGGASSGTFEVAKTNQHCSSWSIGPRLGIDLTLHATDNFGIYYNGSWTQQATSIHMTTQQTQERPATATKFTIQKGDVNAIHNVGIYSLELGPTWDQWFSNQKYHLQFRATWNVTTLGTGANLSFLNNNNTDILLTSELRGWNIRAMFDF